MTTRERYACFDQFSGGDGQAYGFAAAYGAGETCEQEIIDQLVDLQRHTLEYARRDGLLAEDDLFHAVIHVDETRASSRWSAPSSGTGARLRRPTHSPSEPRLRHRAQSDPRCSSGI